MRILLTLLFLVNTNLWAQEIFPGFIPRFYSINAATDLGVSPEIAHQYAISGSKDISLMDPLSDTNIWNNDGDNKIVEHKLLKEGETVFFKANFPGRLGKLRVNIQTEDSKEFTLILSKKIHNILLRKNILEKLGFKLPEMQWLPKINIVFESTIDRDLFIANANEKLLASADRWIIEKNNLTLTIQDVLIKSPKNNIYDLSLGLMNPAVHLNKRVLRSPYVPISLVDTPESVNLMPWQAGRLVMNQIKLNHSTNINNSYTTSFEDAKWIARRIAKLSREDFTEIIEKSYLPKEVSLLLLEKIISRRNDLLKILGIEKEFSHIEFNSNISYGEHLIQGEVKKEFFAGYASRFSFGDPRSPFSVSEIGSFVLTQLQSEFLRSALSRMNKFISTDNNELYKEKIIEIIKKKGIYFPTQMVIIPSFHGQLLLSRNVVTGSYLGTKHRVQLVDTIGFALDAGLMYGIEGLPTPVNIKGGAKLSFQRTYSHIRPVETFKKSLKEPYKNMLVNISIKKFAESIKKLSTVPPEEQEATMNEVIKVLKDSLKIGESFIVSDSLAPTLEGNLAVSPSQLSGLDPKLLKIQAGFQASKVMLSRFHFYRADEDTFQLYQDKASGSKLLLSFKLKSYIPILSLSARWKKLSALTHFYPISLSQRNRSIELLQALRKTLLALNHAPLKEVVSPHVIKHKIGESAKTINFLFFRHNRVKSKHHLEITHTRGGEAKYIFRRYDASTSGKDYESYARELVNTLFEDFLKLDVSLSDSSFNNPGHTILGSAKNKVFSSEFDGERFSTVYERIYNGWKVNKDKLRKLIKKINREYGGDIFHQLSFKDTKSILLYNINMKTLIVDEGIQKMLSLTRKEIIRLLKLFPQNFNERSISEEALADSYLRKIKKIKKLIYKKPSSGLKRFHSLLKSFIADISIIGVKKAIGDENILIQGRIDGFRKGDESGDSPIFSHTFGTLPVQIHETPTEKMIRKLKILPGELLSHWLIERAL